MYRDTIRTFLKNYISDSINDDQDIFSGGYVNSLFATQLVLFIEENFDLTVESEDLNLDNFKSINAINFFIAAKKDGKR
ncbi:acyl carrier protein [candidate division KSB1 bacterium]|nr:acyl carrier protein [candidate division KSB1 bacterium]